VLAEIFGNRFPNRGIVVDGKDVRQRRRSRVRFHIRTRLSPPHDGLLGARHGMDCSKAIRLCHNVTFGTVTS